MKLDLLFYAGDELMYQTQCEFENWANVETIEFAPKDWHPTHVAVALDGVTLGRTPVVGLSGWTPGCMVRVPKGAIWVKKDAPRTDLADRIRDKVLNLECRGDFATAELLEECWDVIERLKCST
jgi:hypothetical protein